MRSSKKYSNWLKPIKLTLIKKINAKFNRTLFTEDFETVGFYLKEIQQSLTKLCKITHQNEEQIVFMAEHLLGQCTALTEAMNRKHKKAHSAENSRATSCK